jgi:aquaporin Z
MPLFQRSLAELIGTFWLVLGGCGSAALAAVFLHPEAGNLGIGFAGVALAFGLTVLTMAYAIGHISGCHLNPAVSVGLAVGGRFSFAELPIYIVAQVLGAIAAAFVLLIVLQGQPDFALKVNSLAVNGFSIPNGIDLSPGHFGMMAALVTEVVMTAMFLIVILGATDKAASTGFAGLAIGLCLTLIHLISIPVTNTSVNPARSTGPALVLFLNGQPAALGQVWLFWVAPIAGAIIGAILYALISSGRKA